MGGLLDAWGSASITHHVGRRMHPDAPDPRIPCMKSLRSAVLVLALPHYGMHEESANDPTAPVADRDSQLVTLLRSAASGNARAFDAFYTATVRQAMSLARRIAGEAYADDVLADAYFQAWREADRFDGSRGTAMAWLLTLTRSRALDRLRQETLRHAGLAGAPDHDTDANQSSDERGPPDLLESVEARSRLHNLLTELSPNERWVLGLAYFRDHSQSEIARITGLPLGTVKSLINRAQHKLRESFEIPVKS
jgi:RNA polymerase sigma-70 factor (ECF subfamily)